MRSGRNGSGIERVDELLDERFFHISVGYAGAVPLTLFAFTSFFQSVRFMLFRAFLLFRYPQFFPHIFGTSEELLFLRLLV